MKEAAGEANMTVITIVLIGVVAAVGLLLVPRLMKNVKARSCCTDAGWFVSGNKCCDPQGGQACTNHVYYYTYTSDTFKSASLFSACMAE